MEWDGTGMCWGERMGMFWEKQWSLKWRVRGSEDDQRRCGRCKWRRRARVLLRRRKEFKDALNWARWSVGFGEIAVRMGWIWPPPFTGINLDQNWIGLDWYLFKYKEFRRIQTKAKLLLIESSGSSAHVLLWGWTFMKWLSTFTLKQVSNDISHGVLTRIFGVCRWTFTNLTLF